MGGDAPVAKSRGSDFYDPHMFTEATSQNQFAASSVKIHGILSLDASKRNPISFLSEETMVTFAGCTLVIIDLSTMGCQYFQSLDQGGIGAVAVHPSREFLAVAEKSSSRAPNVYLYKYPGMNIVKFLKNGTERAYSAMTFNRKGDMLATVRAFRLEEDLSMNFGSNYVKYIAIICSLSIESLVGSITFQVMN